MNVPVMRGGGGQLIGQPIQAPGLPPRFGGGGANRFFPPRGGFPPVGGPVFQPPGMGGEDHGEGRIGFPGAPHPGPVGLGQLFHLLQGGLNAQQMQRVQQGHTPGGFGGAFKGLSQQQERLLAMILSPTSAHPQLGSPVTYGLGDTTRNQFRSQLNLGMGSRIGTNPSPHQRLLSY